METSLLIGTQDFPPKSARNCKQELKLIDTSHKQRSINGELIQWAVSKKLWTRISCVDTNIPSMMELEIGTVIQIGCIQKLWKRVKAGSTLNLKHKAVDQSITAHDAKGKMLHQLPNSHNLTIPDDTIFISYRPWLTMFITKFEAALEEWDMKSAWQLEAEEL